MTATATARPETTPALAYLDEVVVREHKNLGVDLKRVREALAEVERYRKEGKLALELNATRKVAEAAAQLASEAARVSELQFHREAILRAELKAGNL